MTVPLLASTSLITMRAGRGVRDGDGEIQRHAPDDVAARGIGELVDFDGEHVACPGSGWSRKR